ncbi:MAG TPA: peptidylprolyl isomerase [Pyrinomonadaceae bacterium]|nr:peptidylprolyl isomerase [Pyrinomonadaceae bacterium]
MLSRKFLLASLLILSTQAHTFAQRPRAATPAPAAGVNITAEDMTLIIDGLDLPPEVVSKLSSDATERKNFARDIREMLAAAEEAKAEGYAARPELKLQTELARSFAIAQSYFKQRQAAGATTPEQVISQAEIDAYLKEPGVGPQFEAFLADYVKNGPTHGAPVGDDQKKALATHYGRVMVAMRKGIEAGLLRDRATQLSVMLQQARLLANEYAKDAAPRFKPTDAETDAYVAAHPEYDTKEARAKIEGLLKRAQAGEDFGALAKEYSQDRGSKAEGGELGWFGRGVMIKPFEDAAFALKPGELSGVVETVFGYHIIQVEERHTTGTSADGKPIEEVRARHILIRYNDTPPDPNAPPTTPREQARAAVEQQKRERALDEIAARRNVRVAENYIVEFSVIAPVQSAPGASAGANAATQNTTQTQNAKPASQTPAQNNGAAKQAAPAKRTTTRRNH